MPGRGGEQEPAPPRRRPASSAAARAYGLAGPGRSRDRRREEDDSAASTCCSSCFPGGASSSESFDPSAAAADRQQLETADVVSALGSMRPAASAARFATCSTSSRRCSRRCGSSAGTRRACRCRTATPSNCWTCCTSRSSAKSASDAPAAPLLRKLQLPLLRVALQDRGFFVRAQHPARQLLNVVAESGARWLDDDDIDPQLLEPAAAGGRPGRAELRRRQRRVRCQQPRPAGAAAVPGAQGRDGRAPARGGGARQGEARDRQAPCRRDDRKPRRRPAPAEVRARAAQPGMGRRTDADAAAPGPGIVRMAAATRVRRAAWSPAVARKHARPPACRARRGGARAGWLPRRGSRAPLRDA